MRCPLQHISFVISIIRLGIFVSICVFLPSLIRAQSITGRLIDAEFHKGVSSATVFLTENKTTFHQSTFSDANGVFYLGGISKGKYVLQVTAEGYTTIHLNLRIDSEKTDLGIILLQIRHDSLTPAVVNARMPVSQIHGDTMSYNTTHITVKENAVIADLLSKLPGFQLNTDGSITVGGRKVDKLLVDGEDIFANSPGAIVKNLNADMIAKVEVLDKKSQQAEFSGVDDGTRSRTVNLVLKENSRHTSLLKVQAGGDIVGFYETSGSLTRFKDKEQLFVLGMAANTGNIQVNSTVGDHSAGLNLSGTINDPLGASAGTGIPAVVGAGAHYSNVVPTHDFHISANGQAANISTYPVSTSVTRQILPDSIYLQQQASRSSNSILRQQENFELEDKPSGRSDIQIYGQGSIASGANHFIANEASRINDSLVNTNYRAIHDNVSNHDFSLYSRWRQHFKRPDETFSISGSVSQSKSATTGFLTSIQQFAGILPNALDTVDQFKSISNSTLTISGSLDYLRPFKKWLNVSTSYNIASSSNSAIIGTFAKAGDRYSNYIDTLSSNYDNFYLDQRVSLGLQGQNKKFFYSMGLDGHTYGLTQKDEQQNKITNHHYRYFTPRAFFRYGFGTHDQMVLYYGSSFQAPSPNQLQPVQNNTDPLHIVVGNPFLKPSIAQNINLNWYRTAPYYVGFNLFYSSTSTDISTKTMVDALGVQTTQPENLPGSQNFGSNLYLSKKFQPTNIEAGITEGLTINYNHSFINQFISDNRQLTASVGFFARKSSVGQFEFDFRANGGFSASRSSLNSSANTHLWQQNEYLHGSLYLSPTFEIIAVCNYTWRQKLTNFDGTNSTTICGVGCRKYLVHNRLLVSWQLDDLLNQNIALSRSVNATQISETTSNTLGRHWLLTVSYQFANRKK